MTERQDSPRTLFPFQAKQTSPFLLLFLSCKSPGWGTGLQALQSQTTTSSSDRQLVKVTVAPGVCPSASSQGKTLPRPFTKKKCCSAAPHFFELGCVPNFSISLWMWRLGDRALNSCYCHSYLFPGWQFFCTIEPFFVAQGLSI